MKHLDGKLVTVESEEEESHDPACRDVLCELIWL